LVLVLVVFGVLASYVEPAINLVDAWRDANASKVELRQLQHQRARLAAQADSLDDPSAAAEEARSLGMVAPGERPYVIRGLDH
jgi:cell division protein FtsB